MKGPVNLSRSLTGAAACVAIRVGGDAADGHLIGWQRAMVLLLSLLGLLIAVWAWNALHPVGGVVAGFLFIGVAGWKLLVGLPGFARPSKRREVAEGREFIQAWEDRFGETRPDRPDNLPPPGAFQSWLAAYRRTGVRAATWLDREIGSIERHRANTEADCELLPIISSKPGGPGRAYALDDGLVVDLAHGPQVHLPWSSVTDVDVEPQEDGRQTVIVQFGPPAGTYMVRINTDDPSVWLGLAAPPGGTA